MDLLDRLEAESIHILRETVACFARPEIGRASCRERV